MKKAKIYLVNFLTAQGIVLSLFFVILASTYPSTEKIKWLYFHYNEPYPYAARPTIFQYFMQNWFETWAIISVGILVIGIIAIVIDQIIKSENE